MNDIPELDGPEIGPAGGGAPEQLIVFVHGYGADGNDLIGLAPQFADLLPTERTEPEMLAGARTAQPILNQFIGTQLSRAGLQDRNLALIGFSQGTMISLFTGLRRERPMAGILGYSGRLVGAEALAAEISARPPVVLVNGDADTLIPAAAQTAALSALESAAVPVEGHIRPGLGHSIDEAGLEIGRRFLARIFWLALP